MSGSVQLSANVVEGSSSSSSSASSQADCGASALLQSDISRLSNSTQPNTDMLSLLLAYGKAQAPPVAPVPRTGDPSPLAKLLVLLGHHPGVPTPAPSPFSRLSLSDLRLLASQGTLYQSPEQQLVHSLLQGQTSARFPPAPISIPPPQGRQGVENLLQDLLSGATTNNRFGMASALSAALPPSRPSTLERLLAGSSGVPQNKPTNTNSILLELLQGIKTKPPMGTRGRGGVANYDMVYGGAQELPPSHGPLSIPVKRFWSSESFPAKVYRLLAEAESNDQSDIVSFTPDGRSFKIHEPDTFMKDICPKFFRQGHYSSFVRQLNFYGFERLAHGPDRGAFSHPYFVRGRPEYLPNIQRQIIQPRKKKS